jgi:outer membrane protein TolC
VNFHFNSRLCLPSGMAAFRCVIFGVCILLHISGARAEAIYTLEDVLSMAIAQNPVLQIAKAREAGASASTVTARAYQNPDLEMSAGPSRYRTPGGLGDNRNWSVLISQPLEFPSVREARQAMASGNLKAVSLNTQLATIDLEIRVKTAFYDVLQRQATFAMADGDRQILQDIRERVKVRVDVGESPRYELIKAETESLAAELQQFQAMLSERELALNRDISAAYQRYNIAKQQLEAFDNGLLAQAESVLKVAEAAYRFGERGILDYLDAQRTYRVVRKDFQTARYAYVDAILEIQQLLGDSEVGEK